MTATPPQIPPTPSAPAAVNGAGFTIPPVVLATLKHFAFLAALGALGTLIVGVLAFLNGFNIATLPITYQLIAGALLPMIAAALKNAQTEIAAQLAIEQAKNALTAANSKIAELTEVAKALGALPKDISSEVAKPKATKKTK